MKPDTPQSVSHADLLEPAPDPALACLVDDLDVLYAMTPPDQDFDGVLRRLRAEPSSRANGASPVARVRAWWRRPLVGGGLATAAGLAIAAISAVLLIERGGKPVNAQAIYERSQSVVESANAGTLSFHQRQVATGKTPPGTVATYGETWYAGTGRVRMEWQSKDASGTVVSSSGMVSDGSHLWQYTTEQGATTVDAFDISMEAGMLDKKFSQHSGASSLNDVIAEYSAKGCMVAEKQGEGSVAGRAVHIIVVTPRAACMDKAKVPQREIGKQIISVDKRTFFPLKTQVFGADGALVASVETTSIEYDVSIPDSTFNYTPPPEATVTTGKPINAKPGTETDADRRKREMLKQTPTGTPTPQP